MRRGFALWVAMGLASAGGASAEEPAYEVGQENPIRHPGFGALKWGAPVGEVMAAYPELKKRYSPAQTNKALKADQVVILELKVKFRGEPWPARFYVDAEGLHRVVLTRELPRGETGSNLDKFLDPIFGSLPAPETSPGGGRHWKGGETLVTVTSTKLPEADRVEIAFDQPSRSRPDDSGESLDID